MAKRVNDVEIYSIITLYIEEQLISNTMQFNLTVCNGL